MFEMLRNQSREDWRLLISALGSFAAVIGIFVLILLWRQLGLPTR